MTVPFRSRRFTPVPPGERPRKTRRGVRVVVTDGTHVLLFADTDPGVPGSRWWTTPGGGMDPGETEVDTAIRELEEETGLKVTASDLVGPVLRRVAAHGYSDQICEQSESFYVLTTQRFDVDVSRHTAEEQLTLDGHAWLPLAELADLPDPVWPADLAELVAVLDDPQRWPGDIGRIEESTVPI
ncbi:MAG: NUDIX domain-containing protein [Propionibacteriaceae bacterium]|nr:NUDIX domain-containing protein [Propionibacteriaceae bacterium]